MGFHLKIITPNGEFFNGEVEKLMVKTSMGYIGILRRHIPLVAPVVISQLFIHKSDGVQQCAIAGGILYVEQEHTRILANACECREEIDLERAEKAAHRARERLSAQGENIDIARAEAALQRAINRIRTAQGKED